MRNFSILLLFLLVLTSLPTGSVLAQPPAPVSGEPYEGETLCPPGAYVVEPQDCLALGPSQYLTQLAKIGISYPPPPLPASRVPDELAIIPYQYIKVVTKQSMPLSSSMQDAMAHNIRREMPGGFIFFSYSQREENPSGVFYMTKTGEWVEGSNVSRTSPPKFQGLVFRRTPDVSFGWIMDIVKTRRTPGYAGQQTQNELKRLDFVNVYSTTQADGTDWYLIGPDEWVEKKFIAVVIPNPTPPAGVTNNRWIELNLYQQTLMAYDQGQMVFATLMSSGLDPFYTRPGVFQIYKKLPTETMGQTNPSDFYYLEDVPWTMYFDDARAIHGAYWHSMFGYAHSHGCVNLSIADSRWMFDWAREGEFVYAWDPTGRTPTDPKFYPQGKGGP